MTTKGYATQILRSASPPLQIRSKSASNPLQVRSSEWGGWDLHGIWKRVREWGDFLSLFLPQNPDEQCHQTNG